MTYGEQYKTAAARDEAFTQYCEFVNGSDCDTCPCHKKGCNCAFTWLELEVKEEKARPCPFCNNEYVEVGKAVNGMREVRCICGYRSPAKASEAEAIAVHNRLCKASMANSTTIRVGDTIAYRSCDDKKPEWLSFTVRLIEGGYLYENEDRSGDNIAIECAHKVIVHGVREVR